MSTESLSAPGNWSYIDSDKMLSEEIQQRLPDRVFDFHAHVYRTDDLHLSLSDFLLSGPGIASIEEWRKHIGRQIGMERLCGGLFMPMPSCKCDIGMANEYVIRQVAENPEGRGLLLVAPDTPKKSVEDWLHSPGIVGLKPYSCFSTESPAGESSLEGFAPDWMWRIADERSLIMTIHLVRRRALADTENQTYLYSQCSKYPHARIVLAHCGRGFHAPNTERGLVGIRGLRNLWFDTSAICEPAPIFSVVKAFGVDKLLWGTDFSISEIRGKAITLGDSFYWITPGMPNWEDIYSGCRPTLVGLESLRAVIEAVDMLALKSEDLQKIFCGNAMNLLGMKSVSI